MRKAWNALDVTGMKFGRLTALYMLTEKTSPSRSSVWRCLCDCGNKVEVIVSSLRCGNTKSCGCYKLDGLIKRSVTHNMSKSRLYKTWSDMKARCYNPKNKRYNVYGSRDIGVCPEWKNDFSAFADWANANGYDDLLTIDRVDVNKDYSPDNCQFIPHVDQAKNRNFNRQTTINGDTKTVADWARETGLNYSTLITRINKGWTGTSIIQPLQNRGAARA